MSSDKINYEIKDETTMNKLKCRQVNGLNAADIAAVHFLQLLGRDGTW